MHWMLRGDIKNLDAYIEDTRLLGREEIATSEQLRSLWSRCETEITNLVHERSKLKTEIRTEAGGGSYTTKNNECYQQINQQLRKLRRELRQCDRIAERSKTLPDRVTKIEQNEDKKLGIRLGKDVAPNGAQVHQMSR